MGLTSCNSEDRGVIYLKTDERNCEPHTDDCGGAAELQDEICNCQVSVEQDKVQLHGREMRRSFMQHCIDEIHGNCRQRFHEQTL